MPKPPIAETRARYAVCIGINQYQASTNISDLKFAEQDAQAMYEILLRKGFVKDNCRLLLGAEATSEAIRNALSTLILSKPRSDDLVILYFAGHGIPLSLPDEEEGTEVQSEVFLASYNFHHHIAMSDRGAWFEYILRLGNLRTNFFERTRSKKVLFILDSCYSGDFFGQSYRSNDTLASQYIDHSFGKMSAGRIVLSSCMPQQKAREEVKLGHGIFTFHLIEALEGCKGAVRNGSVTIGSLFDYLSEVMPKDQRPVKSGVEHGAFELLSYPELTDSFISPIIQPNEDETRRIEKETRLRAMFADHSGFMRDRLESFVGRQKELAEIRQFIAERINTGGYITITGQAGQGKSSLIVKLVEEYDPEKVAFHFIPFNPGPDHQVGLLRNLMAHLILKYDLSEIYVASESRPALRDYFPKVLTETTARGGKEVVFIDGLDQLEEEFTGTRDLSFLPINPPPGIVFVLGTRPNDTLKPLELLKPRYEYKLPNLSRNDFDLILDRRKVEMSRSFIDRFYKAMQENALYLDLVAKELAEAGNISPLEVIQKVTDNPDNIFSLSIERFKRQERQWSNILWPVLGVLLAAREPLGVRHLRQIIHVEDAILRDGLRRLGGLVAEDGQGRRYLFHLKLQDYLRQDKNRPNKEYVFASDEEEDWHRRLADWCTQHGLESLWQDITRDTEEQERREYARRHYITHLYRSKEWVQLWEILDKGHYGRAKVRDEPSTRAYAQDLDLGRIAAFQSTGSFEEGLDLLPRLWRYSLLRCSLSSQADNYPKEAFEALVAVRREKEAVGLAELLTSPTKKAEVLGRIANHLGKQEGKAQEATLLILRAFEVAGQIDEDYERAIIIMILVEMSDLSVQEIVKQATDTIRAFRNVNQRVGALYSMAEKLATAGDMDQASELLMEAQRVASTLDPGYNKVSILVKEARALAVIGKWQQFNALIKEAEEVINHIGNDRGKDNALRVLVEGLLSVKKLDQAEAIARSIKGNNQRYKVLGIVATSLAVAGQRDQATKLLKELILILHRTPSPSNVVVRVVAQGLVVAKMVNQAEEVVNTYIQEDYAKAKSMIELVDIFIATNTLEHASRFLEKAISIVHKVQNSNLLTEILCSIAKRLVAAGRTEQANKLLKEAIEKIRAISDSEQREEALYAIATELIYVRRWNETQEIIGMLRQEDVKTEIITMLATASLANRDWNIAIEVVENIPNENEKAKILRSIAEGLIEGEQWDLAENVSNNLLDTVTRAEVSNMMVDRLAVKAMWDRAMTIAIMYRIENQGILGMLGKKLAGAGQWDRAMTVVNELQNDLTKAEVLNTVAVRLAGTGQWDRALSIAAILKARSQEIQNNLYETRSKGAYKGKKLATLLEGKKWRVLETVETNKNDLRDRVRRLLDMFHDDRIDIEITITMLLQNGISEEYILDNIYRYVSFPFSPRIPNDNFYNKDIVDTDFVVSSYNDLPETLPAFWYDGLWRGSSGGHSLGRSIESKVEELENLLQNEDAEPQILSIVTELLNAGYSKAAILHMVTREEEEKWWKNETVQLLNNLLAIYQKTLMTITQNMAEAEDWDRAIDLLGNIENAQERTYIMIKIAEGMTEAKEWDRTLSVLEMLQDGLEKAQVESKLVGSFLAAKEWDRALQLANKLENKSQRDNRLKRIVEALTTAGEWNRSVEVANSLQDIETKSETLSMVIEKLVLAGEWIRVLSIIDIGIKNKRKKAFIKATEIRNRLITRLVTSGEWDNALHLANLVHEKDVKEYILERVAIGMAKAGEWDRAIGVIDIFQVGSRQNEEWTKAINILTRLHDGAEQTQFAHELISRLLTKDQWDGAIQIIHKILDQNQKTHEVNRVIKALIAAHQWDKAINTFDMLDDYQAQARALSEIIEELIIADEWDRALHLAESFHDKNRRAELLSIVAEKLILNKLWDKAIELIDKLQDNHIQNNLLRWTIDTLIEQKIWDRALLLTDKLQNNYEKDNALRWIAESLAIAREWDKALKLAARLQEKNDQESVLNKIAEEAAIAGNVDIVIEALNMLGDGRIKTNVLILVVEKMIKAKEFEKALNLLFMIQNQDKKSHLLCDIISGLIVDDKKNSALEIIASINDKNNKIHILQKIVSSLLIVGELERTIEVIDMIEDKRRRDNLLQNMVSNLANDGKWRKAIEVAESIQDKQQRAIALRELVNRMVQQNFQNEALLLVQNCWLQADTRDLAILVLPIAGGLIHYKPEIGTSFAQAFQQVDTFLKEV